MTSNKVYGQALPKEKAGEKLMHYAGIKYDPALVRVFMEKVYPHV